ncbi:MAG: ABC transporter permease, partial [Pseudomonadota bacterium]|nr:ABC transporter permease [Pseudomonadota bacterium]
MQRTAIERTLGERLWAGAVWTVVGFFVVNVIAMIAAVVTSSFATRWLRSWLPSGWTLDWYGSAWSEFQL